MKFIWSAKLKSEAGNMNILKPADLKRVELLRLTQLLQRHDMTKISITRGNVTDALVQTDVGWRVQRAA